MWSPGDSFNVVQHALRTKLTFYPPPQRKRPQIRSRRRFPPSRACVQGLRHSCAGIHFPMDGLPCMTHQECDFAEILLLEGSGRVGRFKARAAFISMHAYQVHLSPLKGIQLPAPPLLRECPVRPMSAACSRRRIRSRWSSLKPSNAFAVVPQQANF
jgi:hypothetical protein